MRIVNEAKNSAVWGAYGGRRDALTDVRDGRDHDGTGRDRDIDRVRDVINSPICLCAVGLIRVGQQTQFVPGDVKADVKRLIEVRSDAE